MRHQLFILSAALGTIATQPWCTTAAAQTAPHEQSARLRLVDALAEADNHAFSIRAAKAGSLLSRASARIPLKGILPSVRLEAGAMRTTDPIGAFGTLLRQRRVSSDAFRPDLLNSPPSIDNIAAGAVLEVPILNSDAIQGYRAASKAADAADSRVEWTTLETRLNVVRAYYGAVLAADRHQALTSAFGAASAMTRQIEQMLDEGIVTPSDLLQMRVRTNDIMAQQLAAEASARSARQQLGMLLGRDDDSIPPSPAELPASLPSDQAIRSLAAATVAASERSDIRAVRLEEKSARLDASRSTATLLPRLNGIARYDWNSTSGFLAGRPSWTIGLMASWSVFGGASEIADMQVTQARLSAARIRSAAAIAAARLEQDTLSAQLRVKLAQLDLAAQSLSQSREAHRLVQRRYNGGLATIAELLAAEAAETGAALGEAAARFFLIDAIAAYRLSLGMDPGEIALSLDQSETSESSIKNQK